MNDTFRRSQQTAWMRRLTRHWVLMAACLSLVASLSAASCGSDEKEATTTARSPNNLNIIKRSDITRYAQNSPERALLSWFQAIQFRDNDTVRSIATDRAVAIAGEKRLDEAIMLIGSSAGKPRIVSTRTRGDKAAVRVFIESWLPGNPDPVLELPRTFMFVRVGAKWKMSDLSFLIETRAEILEQQRASG
jgi:hypothetical protein